MLRPRGAGRRSGGVPLGRLVLVEVAAAVLLVGWVTRPVLVLPFAVPVAVALLSLVVVRRRRRPAAEWLAAAADFRRRRPGPVPAGTAAGFVPAAECDPALRTMTFTDRAGRAVGMAGDGSSLTAVLRIEASGGPLRTPRAARPLPFDVLYAGLDVDGVRLESVQVVQHARPAPPVRLTWVALRLDPEACPEAVRSRGGGPAGAQRALLRAADHLAARLTAAGFAVSTLAEPDLVAAVATAACARAAGPVGPAPRTAESSRVWRCDGQWHTAYWVGGWPPLGTAPGTGSLSDLIAALLSTPALAATVGLTARRGRDGAPELTGYLRVTERGPDELVGARRRLEHLARSTGVGLVRLDREQAPGVLATLPLGGPRR